MNEPRPLQHLRQIKTKYPLIWEQVADFRARKGSDLPDWPDWCYLPLAAAHAIASGGGRIDPRQGIDIGAIGALAAWRATKGIYRFDLDLFVNLIETPLTGHLPDELFERLPEWCIYIDLQGAWSKFLEQRLFGFYAHLESDANSGRRELRLLLDTDQGLVPIPLHLTGGNLTEAVEAGWVEANKQAGLHGQTAISEEAILSGPVKVSKALAPMISLLLYLCSEEPDIGDARGDAKKRPGNPTVIRTRKGSKEFSATASSAWNVGWRIGAALRKAGERSESAAGDGSHASPRTHLRRAHWHTYLTGEKRTKPKLRWLFPILVGAETAEELPAVVKPVK